MRTKAGIAILCLVLLLAGGFTYHELHAGSHELSAADRLVCSDAFDAVSQGERAMVHGPAWQGLNTAIESLEPLEARATSQLRPAIHSLLDAVRAVQSDLHKTGINGPPPGTSLAPIARQEAHLRQTCHMALSLSRYRA